MIIKLQKLNFCFCCCCCLVLFFFLRLNLDKFQNVFQDNLLILDEKMMNLASLQFYIGDSKVSWRLGCGRAGGWLFLWVGHTDFPLYFLKMHVSTGYLTWKYKPGPILARYFSNMSSALGSEPFLPTFWAHEPRPSTNVCFIYFLDFLDWLYIIYLSNKLHLSKES